MMGFHPGYSDAEINPCIPSHWPGFTPTYRIEVKNPSGKESGVSSMTVDGNSVSGNRLPIFGDGKEHLVLIEM